MDHPAIKKPVNQFLKALPQNFKVEKVLIFGSYGRNSQSSDSDIDLLVVSDNFKKMDEDKRLDILYRASRFIKPEIHPWGVTNEELTKASKYSTVGFAKNHGIYFQV